MRRLLCIFLLLTVLFSSGCQKSSTTQKDNNQLLLLILSMSSALGLSPDPGCQSSSSASPSYVQPTVINFNQMVSGQTPVTYRIFSMKKGDEMRFSKSIADSTCEVNAYIFICNIFGKADYSVSKTICNAGETDYPNTVKLQSSINQKSCMLQFDNSSFYQNSTQFTLTTGFSTNSDCKYAFEVVR